MTVGRSDDIQQHLKALRDFGEQIVSAQSENPESRVKRQQLKAITGSIRQLEKAGVPVPEGLARERDETERAIADLEGSPGGASASYEQLLEITELFGRACRRRPYRDLYDRFRQQRAECTPAEVLRKALLDAIDELGGQGRAEDVMDRVGRALDEQLTEADLDRTRGRFNRWQQNVRREAKKLIAQGLVSKERGGVWKAR